MNLYINSIRGIDQRGEFTEGKTPLLGSVAIEPTVKELESTKDDYSGPATDTSTRKMDYHPILIRLIVV